MNWYLFTLCWISWLVGAATGLWWAGSRRSRLTYEQALDIVWSHHCNEAPYKIEGEAS